MMRLGRPETPESEKENPPPANDSQPEESTFEKNHEQGRSLMDWIKSIWQKKK